MNKEQTAAYKAALVKSHKIRALVTVHDSDDRQTGSLTDAVTGGQVDCDSAHPVERTAKIVLADVKGSLLFQSESPGGASLYADKQISIEYGVWVEDVIGDWVDVPIFYGPISRYIRDRGEVTIEAQGKEAFLLPPAEARDFARIDSRFVGASIVAIARHYGERMFGSGFSSKHKLSKQAENQLKNRTPWDAMKSLAHDINGELHYDGAGYLQLQRGRTHTPTWTFHEGPGGTVLSNPAVSFNLTDAKNHVRVFGKASVKGAQQQLAEAKLTPNHPLSPERLERHGVPRFLVFDIKLTKVISRAAARALAITTLAKNSLEVVDVKFDSLVIPHLEPGDIVRLETPEESSTFVLKAFTIPLNDNAPMSIGHTKHVAMRKGQVRKK